MFALSVSPLPSPNYQHVATLFRVDERREDGSRVSSTLMCPIVLVVSSSSSSVSQRRRYQVTNAVCQEKGLD